MVTLALGITFLIGLSIGTLRDIRRSKLGIVGAVKKIRNTHGPSREKMGKRVYRLALINRIIILTIILIPVYLTVDLGLSYWWFCLYGLLILFPFDIFKVEKL